MPDRPRTAIARKNSCLDRHPIVETLASPTSVGIMVKEEPAVENQPTTEKKPELKAICATCGKPIAEKPQTNVTRYLSMESRCMCGEKQWQAASQMDIVHQEQPVDPAEAAEIEKNLGERYEVLSLLGRGGMGAVYKVKDKTLDQTFAIKILNPQLVEDASSVKRFEQEAKAASNLTHVNLAAVYDYGVGKSGSPYIVMDYLDGENLADILTRQGYLDVPRALDIFIQTVEAIAHAHSKGVIHRDIKPSNIIVEKRDGDTELVKLVDFGIAKVLPSASRTAQMTQTGDIFGSPNYMSPEQCLGNRLDARSDIYEMGCLMYETLTGISPFAAENPIKAILRHVNEDAVPISDLKQEFNVPPQLERVILHCLQREPAGRYQTAVELLKDLNAVRDGKQISIKSLSSKKPVKKASFASRFGPAMGAVGVTVAIIAVCFVPKSPIPVPLNHSAPIANSDPYADADRLDGLSYQYFVKGDYERAIPLLEFGIKTYKEHGGGNFSGGNETVYLADQTQ
ncbi:MAG TPA: serine/threonine-protein kinase, partial [Candidatus Obscuribacterales bacterium]